MSVKRITLDIFDTRFPRKPRIVSPLRTSRPRAMWSAIPVALLCMIVNLSEGKQGSSPEGDEVL